MTANFIIEAKTKDAWLEALRSGDYDQGTGVLYSEERNSYCCLGVLCAVLGENKENLHDVELPHSHMLLGKVRAAPSTILRGPFKSASSLWWAVDGLSLAERNDESNQTFRELADLIEAYVPTFEE